jgi:aldehyde:ferredoxin oxidoreductase
MGKLLRVDLTERRVTTSNTMDHATMYLGGRGIAARIAWDEIGPDVDAFDPENRLIVMTGPLTGTLAPSSGRTAFCGVAPQVYPTPWYTRSNMGGWFGSELKYAGYDGIVVRGEAETPVYPSILDGEIEIEDARTIWGRDTFSTQKYLRDRHGSDVKIACIGPAGEHLVRFAVIQSETENAAGQGGYGAVMGSKHLKAIVVRGTGAVRIADPERFLDLCLAINRDLQGGSPRERPTAVPGPDVASAYGLKGVACSQSCPWRCGWMWRNVPGTTYPGINTTFVMCVAGLFKGSHPFYDWNVGQEAAVELSAVANKLGLNHWSLLLGLAPWLKSCTEQGLITHLDDVPIDFTNAAFWTRLMTQITYRRGAGDAFAEDVPRAAEQLGMDHAVTARFYPAYGFPGHWDGHGDKVNPVFFPLWIVSALQWFTDTRDPFSSGHGYAQNLTRWSRVYAWEKLAKIGARVYGSTKAVDPRYPYEFMAQPAIWHQDESVLKDSLPLCDQVWPRLYSTHTDDGYARITAREGVIDGKACEHHLFVAATGLEVSEAEFRRYGERVFNLERAIQVRNDGRSRDDDLAVIPYFEEAENYPGPSGKLESLDRTKFLRLANEYYALRGWDERGWPTSTRLAELGLDDVAEELERLKNRPRTGGSC